MAAAEDYKKILAEEEKQHQRAPSSHEHVAVKDLFDDPELERLHGERLEKMKEMKEKRSAMERKGHGTYEENVSEASFLEISTSTDKVVAHFSHPGFERCMIMDTHLKILASKYFDTRFVQVSVENAPFLVEKLQIRMLPCVICFQGGIAGERLIGFDALGKRDDFETSTLENKLLGWNVIDPVVLVPEESEVNAIRQGYYQQMQRTLSDEDSDF